MNWTEQEQVRLALDPKAMGKILRKEFGDPLQAGAETACHILDMKYEPGDYCLVLYQLNDQYLIGSYDWGGEEQPAGTEIPALGMHVYRFPDDPALPGLPAALDPARLASVLAQALPELHPARAKILRCQPTVLRFRPGKRCTLRIDLRVFETATGKITKKTYYAKIYHRMDKAKAAYREMRLLATAQVAQDGPVVFADSPGWLPDLMMVLLSPVSGSAMDLYLDCRAARCPPETAAGMRQAAAALASVHTAGLTAGRERPVDQELERFLKRAGKIGVLNPALGAEMAQLARRLISQYAHLDEWGAASTLVHGDCKPSQFFLRDDGKAAILDFDHCGMADPAGDVGNFLATLQQSMVDYAYKHHAAPPCAAWMAELEEEFLTVYLETSHFSADFPRRVVWYEAAALLRKAIRGFERSPYSPVPAMLVAEAGHILDQLPVAAPSV